MSALVGIYRLDGAAVTAHDLQPLMDATAVYGGDQQAVWTDRSVGLGFHMRYLTPESFHEHMPLTKGHVTVVADARIDNRDDLFAALAVGSDERAGMPDSMLILLAYLKWGIDLAIHLIGDFAFAIWDAHAHQLYCARDHIGVRPLYYYYTRDMVIFSSDLKSLFMSPYVVIEPDEQSLLDVLVNQGYGGCHPHNTIYRNIKQLQFGHQLVVNETGIQMRQYWHPPSGATLNLKSEEEYFERTREIVQQAVQARLRTSLGIGSQLSGGIDSSSITVIASRFLREQGRQLYAYSWSPPAGTNPERSVENYRIGAIVKQNNIVVHYLPPRMVTSGFLLQAAEVPFQAPEIRKRLAILHPGMEQAAADGVRLLFSGWGGDEFISSNGSGYRTDLFLRGHWLDLLKTLDWGRFPRGVKTNLSLLWRDVVITLSPDWFYNRFSSINYLTDPVPSIFFKPEFAGKFEKAYTNRIPARYQQRNIKQTQLYLYEKGHIATRIEGDSRLAVYFGISMTYPLLDRRLLEFVFQLPDHLFLRNGIKRYLYRKAMQPLFPDGLFDLRGVYPKTEPRLLTHIRTVEAFVNRRGPTRYLPEVDRDDNPWVDMKQLQRSDAQAFLREDDKAMYIVMSLASFWNGISIYRETQLRNKLDDKLS